MISLPIMPEMRCDKGCTDCCSVAACSDGEYETIKKYAKRHQVKPIEHGLACPWYQDGQCSVYPVRPIVCRVFGHFAEKSLTCTRGYNTNLTGEKLRATNAALENYKPTRFLHEVLPSGLQGFSELLIAHGKTATLDI